MTEAVGFSNGDHVRINRHFSRPLLVGLGVMGVLAAFAGLAGYDWPLWLFSGVASGLSLSGSV